MYILAEREQSAYFLVVECGIFVSHCPFFSMECLNAQTVSFNLVSEKFDKILGMKMS